ncbi:MAG TPA: ribosome biogenesis GTPase Der, partial [Verrucomicrobiae bacterium]|nr:ribosome biogenesis GTPase Der [Verrucomicrobiae bacterium]
MSGLIAIVGRPNVGKSALFNRIVGKRIAIVHDEPGVTRDRVTAEAEWQGRKFTLIDTGGIGLMRGEKAHDVITEAALEQVALAIEAAEVIILTVNAQEGIVPLDREVAARLRKTAKPVLIAANKVDNPRLEPAATEFVELGFEKVFPVSAIHGEGIDPLMVAALGLLPPHIEEPLVLDGDVGERPLKLAIVGRPNVGKSSIINALTRSQRVVVSPTPGTTRDAIDVPFEVEAEGVRQKYVLIDTAGVRQERRIDDSVEFYSVKRTDESIARADIVIFMIDAGSGITMQDKKIGGKIVEEQKACIVVVNKWDLVDEGVRDARKKEIERRNRAEREQGDKQMTTLSEFAEWVQKNLFFLDYAPVIFTSAKSGFHLERLLEAVRYVGDQLKQKVPTSLLNRALRDAIVQRQPISAGGHHLKFFYATQVRQSPPTFALFVNRDELFSPAYNKYLAGQLRKAFGFEGCPLILNPRPRPKTIAPVRKRQIAAQVRKAITRGN